MYIGDLPSQIKSRKRMWQINGICLLAVFAFSVFTLFSGEEEMIPNNITPFSKKQFSYEEIGWGPLASE
ncbi:MAG: hypothetical protein LVR00_08380 [Rhabdochlamydiaceae bacterium]|jgi:hypothetical protein